VIQKNEMLPEFTSTLPYTLAAIALVIASYTDLKTREVPDWLNYGLVGLGIMINLIFSLAYSDYFFILSSIIGFAVFFGFGALMFYTGQWGGGDSKAMMALGAILGLSWSLDSLLIAFFINAMIAGAAYGLAWSIGLALFNWKKFFKALVKLMNLHAFKKARRNSVILAVGLIVISMFIPDPTIKIGSAVTAIVILLMAYMYAFIKAVELACMYKKVSPEKLTEGDWIAKDVKVKGKYICGPKDLGIEKKQIRQLVKLYKQNKVKKILIKEGIPFVPSFFIAYVVSLVFGNLLFLLV